MTKSNFGTTLIRAGTYGEGNAQLRGSVWLLLILNSMHNTATEIVDAQGTASQNPALLKTQDGMLRSESAADHHLDEQYSKTGRTKQISERTIGYEILASTFS